MIHKQIQNKYSFLLSFGAVIGLLLFSSCSDSSTGSDDPEPEIQSETVTDLYAPSARMDPNAKFVFFSFRTGETVDLADSASTSWDVGFRGTDIIINSGESGPGTAGLVRLDVPFEDVTIAPSEGYQTDDSVLAMDDWYTYTGTSEPQHAVFPNENETYVLKTADGNHYVKFEIISYYKGNPDTSTEEFANLTTRPDGGYFTFNYVIQLEEDLRELE